LAWVVSLSAHSVVLAALGWSLPGRPSTRWIAVTPGQASIALLASPAAEFVAAKPDPPLPEPRRPAEEPLTATPVELAPQAETVVRRETPHAPPSDWAELALAELPPERPPAELPMVPSRRDLTDQTPPVPNETDSSPPRADDAERQAELPPSTADARPSLASLDSQGAQDQAPAAVHNPAPEYPAAALQARQTGRVVLLVGIQPDGSVAWAKLAQPSGVSSLDQAALQVIRRWRFSPTDEATAVRTIRVPFRFVLDE
jgi:protein TonB